MSNLGVVARVDARGLAINKRYRSNGTIPTEVREAKDSLAGYVFEAVVEAAVPKRQGELIWQPPNPAELIIDFYFPTMRSDLDGPIKHTLDAIEDGIRRAGYEWNDRSIHHIEMTRRKGEGLILFFLRDYDV